MKIVDSGVIISIKKYGEDDAIIKIFSQDHGICRGFVKKIGAKKNRAIFQIGNLISFEWKSRTDDGLGAFYYPDLVKSYIAKIMFEKLKLQCFTAISSIIDNCFFERDSHRDLYEKFINFLDEVIADCQDEEIIAKYILLEQKVLDEIGYGLDLSCCAATGQVDDLCYISPKTARAVSKEAGLPYHDKLLKLPQFILDNFNESEVKKPSSQELQDGFKINSYFLDKFIFSQSKSSFSSRKSLEAEVAKIS